MKTFKERTEAYIKSDQRAQARYGVITSQRIVFGDGTHIPLIGKLALYLLRYSRGRVIQAITDAPMKEVKRKKK